MGFGINQRQNSFATFARRSNRSTATNDMQTFGQKKYINVFLSIGSNIGDRMTNLRQALGLIEKNIGKVAKKSHIYETQPWGEPNQDAFLNQVVMINTSLEPREMLEKITRIEREMGRERKEKWGPRVIDVDILFYGKRIIRDKGLEIPHPELHKRGFVLVPLMEIAPEFEHPILLKQIDELYMDCEDNSDVVMLD
jgi:2-amino-4-hydroxy-6-hydroxymethyldihydropteridine diphosphokinase